MTTIESDIRDEVIVGILLDKEFDVPVEIYDMVTDKMLVKMFLSEKQPMKWYLDQYLTNPSAREFFDFIRESKPSNYLFFDAGKEVTKLTNDIAYDEALVIPRLLIFSKKDWYIYWKKIHKKNPGWWITYFIEASSHPELDHQSSEILSIMLTYDYREEIIIDKIKGFVNLEDLVRLLYKCNVHKYYGKIMTCINLNIPILFSAPDETDVWIYLKTVLSSGYRGELDSNIEPILKVCEINEVGDLLYEIGSTLNQNNLKYYFRLKKEKLSTTDTLKLLTNKSTGVHGNHMSPSGRMTDFDILVSICGNNSYGLPINVQMLFLEQGGNIETMFDENGKLKDEASIIKTTDQLSPLLSMINDNQLRYLLLNSPDFVKNILTSTWLTVKHYIRILKALLVYPVDEDLWRVLNTAPTNTEDVDYRFLIVNKIRTMLETDVIFDNVPEAMMYIEPSVLYITRNIDEENIFYIPVDKIVPYIQQYVGRHDTYEQLNLFCNGETVSITSAVNDDNFLIKEIVRGKKYGYICDIKTSDMRQLLDEIIRTIRKERS